MALARKLLIALWRYLEWGVLPEGALLKEIGPILLLLVWFALYRGERLVKTKGYHLEHNFGHGEQFLANFMLTLNLLAFLFHTLLDLLDEQYHALRQELVARKDFFNDLRALLRYMVFDNWNHLMHFMLVGLELIPDTGGPPLLIARECRIAANQSWRFFQLPGSLNLSRPITLPLPEVFR